MARRKEGTRREPVLEANPTKAKPPRVPKRAPAPEPPLQPRRGRGAAPSEGVRSPMRRLFYWTVVLGLWGIIALTGVFTLAILNLPPIQSLEIPKRPPTIRS